LSGLRDYSVKKLVTAALFAALVCIATIIFVIPLPGSGFVNLGDCVVIAAGCLLGPLWGAAAAAIGAALADVFLGYAIYFPGTFVVKGLMAAVAFAVLRLSNGGKASPSAYAAVTASLAAELVMVCGYFVYEIFLLGSGAAAADLLGNCLQASVGMLSGAVLLSVLLRSERLREILK
jgi:uncharacterized membrane protein